MDTTVGIGTAIAALRPDDGQRYQGCLMLSALPQAPTIDDGPTRVERILRLLRKVRYNHPRRAG
jgi:hypothetical protein